MNDVRTDDIKNTISMRTCMRNLKELLEDWERVETNELAEQAEILIIQKAEELLKITKKNQKSEMPCNCNF